jgi:predicted regulator of Ras-like GTPase activity (Roadblock/LC7/MglB family)
VTAFAKQILAVTRHRGVSACLVVAEEDGILVDGTAQIGVNTQAFAALTASLYRKAARAATAAGFGAVSFFELEAEQGRVLAAGRNGLIVVAVGEPRVNVGLLRVELLKAAETLA